MRLLHFLETRAIFKEKEKEKTHKIFKDEKSVVQTTFKVLDLIRGAWCCFSRCGFPPAHTP